MGSLRAGAKENSIVTSPGTGSCCRAPLLPSCQLATPWCTVHVHVPALARSWGEMSETYSVLEGRSLYPEEGVRSSQEEVLMEGGLQGEGS